MHRATLEDVAALAGVSIKTVSRVVNKEPNVSPTTQEKVAAAIEALNYKPNLSARNLASQRSHLIGLVYDDPSAYELPSAGYIINMQEGALKACKQENYDLLIHPCNPRDKRLSKDLQALVEQARPDGIILAAPLSNMPKVVNLIEQTGTELVRLSPGSSNGGFSSIATNDEEVSAEMTAYLYSLGHRKIGFITGHPSHKAVAKRFSGFKQGLKNCGLKFSEALVMTGDNSIGSGEICGEKFLARKAPPTAIFAANDDMAVGVMRSAEKLGLKIPNDISIAGFDDIALARQVYPALTTVSQPLAKMTENACRLLIQAAKNADRSVVQEVIPGRLEIRETTETPRKDR